jgi:hypothetical protein
MYNFVNILKWKFIYVVFFIRKYMILNVSFVFIRFVFKFYLELVERKV